MPIERAHPLDEVLDAAARARALTGLAPMWAVTLLAGVNDTDDDAHALAELRRARSRERTGARPRLSVIPYNAIGERAIRSRALATRAKQAFRDALARRGVFTHKRYSGGGDVDAACGQLAARG